MACGVGEGDEVIVPAMTFVASASAVLSVNATPVIVDVDPETLCIDVAAAEAAIGERTRAIIAVHVAGAVCDLDLLVPLCERRGLHLIEDCAHAHGSQWRGRGAGSYGSFGSFSMQQGKLMTAGEGGALIGNDPQLLDAAWNYADCGRERGRWFYHHATIGSNFRMTEWQGAVLLASLNASRSSTPCATPTRSRWARRSPECRACAPSRVTSAWTARATTASSSTTTRASSPECRCADSRRRCTPRACRSGSAIRRCPISTSSASRNFAPTRRASAPALDYASLHLPVAEHAAASTVWMEHRLLLADRDRVLLVAEAAARIREHAAAIMEKMPIGAGA